MFLRKNEERDVIHNCVISKGIVYLFPCYFGNCGLQSKKTGLLELLYLIYQILSNKIIYTLIIIIIIIIIIIDGLIKLVVPLL
jgi:hypothetical protein